MSSLYRLGRRVVHKLFAKRILPLDERLASMEQVFHAPPLTRELVAAIRLISPHLDFGTGEKYRLAWEKDQNGSCWGEYEALASLLTTLPRPEKILEIGPGVGRSAVFFSKKLGWRSSDIHLYEGDGNTTRYTTLGPRCEDSFCGNIAMLRYVLEYNGIHNVTLFDAKEWKLRDLPGPYDLLYSFYSIGFHWSLEHFLDDLLPLMHEKSIAIFTVPNEFVGFPRLEELSHRIIDWKAVWPKESWHKMLILSKGGLP
jgi:hypothetical protein